jgi:adenylate kinase family enzyme
VRRVAVIASASGNGKTTVGRALAARLGVPFVELDALVHGPGRRETPDHELHALVEPIVRSDAWVIDGTYRRKLGMLVFDAADTIVWLDLPIRVWLPRLLRRTAAGDALPPPPRLAGRARGVPDRAAAVGARGSAVA